MLNLSDDEYVVLAIAAEGQSMMQVGRWQRPTEHLVELGYLVANDKFNCFITPAGRQAAAEHEKKTDDASLRIGVDIHNIRVTAKRVLEEASLKLAEAAQLGQRVAGGDIGSHVEQAAQEIIRRAKEIVR